VLKLEVQPRLNEMNSSVLQQWRLVAANLGLVVPARHVLKKLADIDHFYLLSARLERIQYPRMRSDLRFAEARAGDFEEMLRELHRWDAPTRKEVVARVLFHRRGMPGCYVGRDGRGELASVQWLLRPRDNPLLQRYFHRCCYPLKPHEVMIENVLVFPPFRGLGTFPAVNRHVVEVARAEGFHACNAYVRKDNVPSLNAFLGLGFRITKLLTAYNLAGSTWRNL
jgi:RimJ/RimL family protein N-acetyltransferase